MHLPEAPAGGVSYSLHENPAGNEVVTRHVVAPAGRAVVVAEAVGGDVVGVGDAGFRAGTDAGLAGLAGLETGADPSAASASEACAVMTLGERIGWGSRDHHAFAGAAAERIAERPFRRSLGEQRCHG